VSYEIWYQGDGKQGDGAIIQDSVTKTQRVLVLDIGVSRSRDPKNELCYYDPLDEQYFLLRQGAVTLLEDIPQGAWVRHRCYLRPTNLRLPINPLETTTPLEATDGSDRNRDNHGRNSGS
jgi:hypothetical protein